MNENIAIYGGAFNPPTLGHIAVIEKILTSTKIEKIILVPDGERHDKNIGDLTIEQRKEMMEVFFQILENMFLERVELYKWLLERKWKIVPTTVLERAIRKNFWVEPWFIFGTDVIEWMKKWKRNNREYVEKKLKKILIQRPGYEVDINKINNYEMVDVVWTSDISSTTVRERLRNRESVGDLLHPKIEEFIKKRNLYI